MNIQPHIPDGPFSFDSTPNSPAGSQMEVNVNMELSNDNFTPSPDKINEFMEVRAPIPEEGCSEGIPEESGDATLPLSNVPFDTSLFVSQDFEDWSLMETMLSSTYFSNPVVFPNSSQNEPGTEEPTSTHEAVDPVTSRADTQDSSGDISPSVPIIDFEWPDDTGVDDGSRFNEAQAYFNALKNPSDEDLVKYFKARRSENSRRKQVEIREMDEHLGDVDSAAADPTMENDSEFSSPMPKETMNPSDEAEVSGDKETNAIPNNLSQKAKRTFTGSKRIFVLPKERKRAMEVGLFAMIGASTLAKKLYMPGKATANPQDDATGSLKPGTRRTKTKFTEEDLGKMLSTKDLIATAQISSSMRPMPTSKHLSKTKALAELVASIPSSDKEEARSDRDKVLHAIKQFNRKPRHCGEGRWKMKGLKTPLMYHQASKLSLGKLQQTLTTKQILAAGWMRERERSVTRPLGGLLCDIMGFGKTLTALTNILDDANLDEDTQRAPTLIVVPSSPLSHWAGQISLHCDSSIFGAPMQYTSRTSFDESHNIASLKKHAVVLTTYEEVRRSYPAEKSPNSLDSKEAIEKWWGEHYDREVGLLHKIKWHRILLDEGHIIKNAQSQTSVAIQALTGNFKWVLSGTPLHNCIEELYPYFFFLEVPKSWSFQVFQRQFCNPEDPVSKDRLVNTLRSFLHRQTHESRLFGTAMVQFPPITEDTVKVQFCEAEKMLYEKIADIFLERINDLSGPGNLRSQKHCILTMFLKMRMFASHLLTAQDIIQHILDQDEDTLKSLEALERSGESDMVSIRIAKLICAAKARKVGKNEVLPTEGLIKQRPSGDLSKLTRAFRAMTAQDREEEHNERYKCPYCRSDPLPAIITSCGHLYCEECFNAQPDKKGNTDTTKSRICFTCKVPIEEAAYWSSFGNINRFKGLPSSRKRRRTQKGKKASITGSSKVQMRKAFSASKTYGMFHFPLIDSKDEEQQEEEEDDDINSDEELIQDWIPLIGKQMPGAKLTKTRDIVKSWIEKDPDSKIVIFTFFLDTIRLLEQMCDQEGWAHNKLSGKMPQDSRNDSLSEFQTAQDAKVMIATYKTGGYGLDFSVANKCILLDLWWNEAVQEQAYGRLLRLNQLRPMECIKIIAESTHDEAMLTLQRAKTQRIEEVVSLKVLEERASIQQLLEYFGDVTEVRGGGFKIARYPRAKKKKAHKDKSLQEPNSKGGTEGEAS